MVFFRDRAGWAAGCVPEALDETTDCRLADERFRRLGFSFNRLEAFSPRGRHSSGRRATFRPGRRRCGGLRGRRNGLWGRDRRGLSLFACGAHATGRWFWPESRGLLAGDGLGATGGSFEMSSGFTTTGAGVTSGQPSSGLAGCAWRGVWDGPAAFGDGWDGLAAWVPGGCDGPAAIGGGWDGLAAWAPSGWDGLAAWATGLAELGRPNPVAVGGADAAGAALLGLTDSPIDVPSMAMVAPQWRHTMRTFFASDFGVRHRIPCGAVAARNVHGDDGRAAVRVPEYMGRPAGGAATLYRTPTLAGSDFRGRASGRAPWAARLTAHGTTLARSPSRAPSRESRPHGRPPRCPPPAAVTAAAPPRIPGAPGLTTSAPSLHGPTKVTIS